MSYNGWKNYETWLVRLWIGDDEGLKEEVRELSLNDAEDYLKSFVEQIKEDSSVEGMLSDLLNAAISEVDFREIAEAMQEV